MNANIVGVFDSFRIVEHNELVLLDCDERSSLIQLLPYGLVAWLVIGPRII